MDSQVCSSCGQPLTVEQPMTSLGYLLTGALLCLIVVAVWGGVIYYAPLVVRWWGGMQ